MAQSFPIGQAPWETKSGTFPVGQAPWEASPTPTITPNSSESIWAQMANAAKGGLGQIGAGIQQAQPVGGGGLGGLIPGVGKILGGAAQVVTAPLAPVLNPTVGAGINAVADKLSDFPAVQQFANSPAGRTTADIAETVSNYANAAGTIAGAEGLATKIPSALSNIKESLNQPLPPEPPPSSSPPIKVEAPQIAKMADLWQKPALEPTAAFTKARAVLAQTPEIPQFLAKQGINLYDNLDNGRYATEDTAGALRDTAGQLSRDTLRPSLQQADYSTPRTNLSEVQSKAIARVSTDTELTPHDMETAINNVNKEIEALQTKYPSGMSLTDMHDAKITYSKNGGYSPIKSASDNIKATANRNIGSVLGDLVEQKAPPDIPVDAFNQYLSQYYKAADYLDTLNTKKAPISLTQYVAHKAAQVVGAGIGHTVGGGILGGVGGYMIGGALEHAIENIALPMRGAFIRNLEITHPEIIPQLEEYLKQQGGAQLKLPAPTNASPIPLGPDTTKVPINIPAKQGPTGITPKGKFTKTYTSTP